MATSVSTVSRITDYLYLSGLHAMNEQIIKDLQITCIVDATNYAEDHVKYYENTDYLRIPIEDDDNEIIHLYFELVSNKIREHRFRKGKTLVHCLLGMSRSATLVLGYLISVEEMTLRDAYLMLRRKRNCIRPNMNFWNQLIGFEKMITAGDATVHMVKRGPELIPDVLLELRSNSANSLVLKKMMQNMHPNKHNFFMGGMVARFRYMTMSQSSEDVSSTGGDDAIESEIGSDSVLNRSQSLRSIEEIKVEKVEDEKRQKSSANDKSKKYERAKKPADDKTKTVRKHEKKHSKEQTSAAASAETSKTSTATKSQKSATHKTSKKSASSSKTTKENGHVSSNKTENVKDKQQPNKQKAKKIRVHQQSVESENSLDVATL